MAFKHFGLIFLTLILAIFFTLEVKAQEDMGLFDLVVKRQALQAEQDELGEQWQENQNTLEQIGVQYDALDVRIAHGKVHLGRLKEDAEILIDEYERKLPEFNRRQAALKEVKEQLANESEIYYSDCDVTVTEEEYPQKFAECQATYARLVPALEKNLQDFDQLIQENQTYQDMVGQAVDAYESFFGELKDMEAQQQSLLSEGVTLQAASDDLVQAGLELDVQIQELDRLIPQLKDTPINLKEYQATTGAAFTEGQKLTKMVEATNWPMKAKATFLLGVLMAGRGSYDKAVSYFQTALQTVPNETWIAAALDHIRGLQAEQAVRKGSGPIAQGMIDPATLGYLPKTARDRILIAMSLVDVGDFAGAIGLLNEARRTIPTDQNLRGAEIYVSQLLAQKRERESSLSDQEKAEQVATSRANGRRNAAWTLGLYLSDYGDNDDAIFYFKEAQKDFPPDSYNYRLLDQMITNVSDLAPTPEFPLYFSKADALLDALQYGDGSLDRSVRYLEAAFKASPENLFVRDALNYVQGMSIFEEK